MLPQTRRLMVKSRFQQPSRNFTKFLPNLSGVNGQTTLGELADRLFYKYQYRLAIPIVAWVGVLWYTCWTPYENPEVKQKQLERMELLKSKVYTE